VHSLKKPVEREELEDLALDGNVILKRILEK
jgi:hypothetical protein